MTRRLLAATGLLAFMVPLQAQRLDVQPELQIEMRAFSDDPQFPRQLEAFQGGVVATGDLRWRSGDRRRQLRFEPYLRLDSQDSERSYLDIRELSFTGRSGDWSYHVGIDQVFWGVAESRNVVDVINQFDTIEDFDQGEKLGQPMLRLERRAGSGSVEAYYLPYFREQKFPGSDGRLRFGRLVDSNAARYERGGEEWAGDFALRYAARFGGIDLGLHGFYGTSRDPLLQARPGSETFTPVYQQRQQAGYDLQYTRGAWLLKSEMVLAEQGGDRFPSSVTGVEYSLFDAAGSGVDIGFIGEYLRDGRSAARTPFTLFDDDVFLGTRLTWNDLYDTELLAGAIVDRKRDAVIGSIEFQRRIGTRAVLEVEARYFHAAADPLVRAFARDSHLTARFSFFL